MRTQFDFPGSAARRERMTLLLLVAAWMIFIVSVLAFSRAQAQSVSLTDQNAMLEMYRQSQAKGSAAPDVYTSPSTELRQPTTLIVTGSVTVVTGLATTALLIDRL
jgi:hypothetical protein